VSGQQSETINENNNNSAGLLILASTGSYAIPDAD